MVVFSREGYTMTSIARAMLENKFDWDMDEDRDSSRRSKRCSSSDDLDLEKAKKRLG